MPILKSGLDEDYKNIALLMQCLACMKLWVVLRYQITRHANSNTHKLGAGELKIHGHLRLHSEIKARPGLHESLPQKCGLDQRTL